MNETECKNCLVAALKHAKAGELSLANGVLGRLLDNPVDDYWRRQALILRATLFERQTHFNAAEGDLRTALSIPNQTDDERYSIFIALADVAVLKRSPKEVAVWLIQAATIASQHAIHSYIRDLIRLYPPVHTNLTVNQIRVLRESSTPYLKKASLNESLDEMSLLDFVQLLGKYASK